MKPIQERPSLREPIRVGLIRCDTHGLWFGPLIDDHDAALLQHPVSWDEPAVYSWQRGIVHYYLYSAYRQPGTLTARNVSGFTITRLWDENRAAAELTSRIFHNRPRVCDRFEDVSDDVDMVLIADCNGNGDDHLRLARPGLEKGLPTFIDKPMALTVDDAVQLFELSRKHDAPILSASLYQTDPNTLALARRLPEVGRLSLGVVQCSSTHEAATIGAACAVHTIFGDGVQRVSCLHVPKQHVIYHLDYGNRTDRPSEGVSIHCSAFDNPFPSTSRFSRTFAAAYGWETAIQGLILDGYSAADGATVLMERARTMVHTGQTDMELTGCMVRAVAICQAMRESLQTCNAVVVSYPELPIMNMDQAALAPQTGAA